MSEVKATYARAGPHRKRLGNDHSGVRLHIEQTPECAFLSMIRARRVTRSRPDPTILLLDQIRIAQAFFATITPFISNSLVQAFGKSFSQAIGKGLRHDCVIVVV